MPQKSPLGDLGVKRLCNLCNLCANFAFETTSL